MRAPSVALLFDDRRERARGIAVVAIATLIAFWIGDASFDAVVWSRRGWFEELLHPTGSEAWMRLLVAVLVTLLFVVLQQRARLQVLSSAVDEAPDGVQIADLTGHVVYSNAAIENIYGFSPDELRGKHVNSMNADSEYASRVILPAIQQTGRWAGEIEVKHKDGRTFPIWLTTAIVVGARGRPAAFIGIVRDVTERRRIEQELRDYAKRLEEATRLKDLFADILRHDLLGPAGALRLSIDTLARRETNPATLRLVDNMRRSCSRLIDLIEHAAKYAKISALEQLDMRTLDLRALIQEAVADLQAPLHERNARILLPPAGELPIRANPLLTEVFANLVSNAIKYGPDGGTVTIDVKDGGDAWMVSVSDRGCGIPDADKERIFTRFERLKREGVKGTGLGLAIARRTVEMHGGRISVEDNPGGGTVFRVALPKGVG